MRKGVLFLAFGLFVMQACIVFVGIAEELVVEHSCGAFLFLFLSISTTAYALRRVMDCMREIGDESRSRDLG